MFFIMHSAPPPPPPPTPPIHACHFLALGSYKYDSSECTFKKNPDATNHICIQSPVGLTVSRRTLNGRVRGSSLGLSH